MSRPPRPPPPIGQSSRPSNGGHKDPPPASGHHKRPPPIAPKPDIKKLLDISADANTKRPVAWCLTGTQDQTSEQVWEKDKVHFPEAQRDSRVVVEEVAEHGSSPHRKARHSLPGRPNTGDKPMKRIHSAEYCIPNFSTFVKTASSSEKSKMLSAMDSIIQQCEDMYLERKAKTSPGSGAPWRSLDWSGHENMRHKLRKLQVGSPDVEYLRILVYGPVGAGKSSFINSIASIFRESIYYGAAVASIAGTSFTKTLQTHYIHDNKSGSFLPFAICDIMGLESEDSKGVRMDDLVKVLQGHIKDVYKFKDTKGCATGEPYYRKHPSLSERIHCLVSVIPADRISIMEEAVIDKMRRVRDEAVDLRIPQLVVFTKADLACPDVSKDLKHIYSSKRIKEKMQACSNRLGVPMNCIFPVKNYHEEIDFNSDVDVLLLSALQHILNSARDYVIDVAHSPGQTN